MGMPSNTCSIGLVPADILERPLLHHTLGDYAKPMRMFQMITCDAALLMDARTAPAEVDRVLATALAQKRPVVRPC